MRRLVAAVVAALLSTRRFRRRESNEWAVLPWRDALMGCCDCGLMHRYDFRARPDGRLEVRARRAEAPTIASRRDGQFRFTARGSTA